MLTLRSTPEDGDLVVREGSRDGERVYILRTAPGAGQYVVRSRDDAIAQATRFAMRLRVRVWLDRDGEDGPTLIVDCRSTQADDDWL